MGECVNAISIHAPTKGATRDYAPYTTFKAISIHAPTKGATILPYHKILARYPFQSTLPRRERQCPDALQKQFYKFQSTLPRRERRGNSNRRKHNFNFNPRSHEGSDLTLSLVFRTQIRFQSTLPRRERQQFYPILHLIFFNFH